MPPRKKKINKNLTEDIERKKKLKKMKMKKVKKIRSNGNGK